MRCDCSLPLTKEENVTVEICEIGLQYLFMISNDQNTRNKVGVAASVDYLCEWQW